MALRRGLARWLVKRVVRPGLRPGRPLRQRRRGMERAARAWPLPRGIESQGSGPGEPSGTWWLPPGLRPESDHGAILYLHGGGFMLGSPASHRAVAAHLARTAGRPVFVPDYRLAPEHPCPAAQQDAERAWRWLGLGVERPLALAGDSAGAWLALALALDAGRAGLPRPAGMAFFSPLVDLAEAEAIGLQGGDLMLPAGFLAEGVRAFRGLMPAGDPRLGLPMIEPGSLPPVFLAFDDRELLAAQARALAARLRAAGGGLRVEAATGLWHAWPLFAGLLPDADATLRQAAVMLFPSAAP